MLPVNHPCRPEYIRNSWGAVANEAMNSGCALIAGHMIGAVPYLIEDGENGLVYRDGDRKQLFLLAERLVKSRKLCDRLGRNAYRQINDLHILISLLQQRVYAAF